MKSFYKDKTVWITGASSGIGEAMALILSEFGTKLILTSENKNELLRVEKLCLDAGAKEIQTIQLDQSDSIMVDNVVLQISEQNPSIDVLILNAGISQRSSVTDTKIEVHDKIMQINFRSNVQIINKILPKMIENGSGFIGVTSSISGKFGFHLRSGYASSKHALHGFFESLRLEYAAKNIFVTIVCPGRVKTRISYHALHGDGEKHGKMDAGQEGGVSAKKCAKKYLMAIKNKKKEKMIGGKEIIMAYLKRFCPCIFYFIIKKLKPY